MRNHILLASIATALLGACVGGIDTPPGTGDDDDPGPGSTAREIFDRTVLPLLSVGACGSCHTGLPTNPTSPFLGEGLSLANAYDTMIKDRAVVGGFDPSAATLLTKGAHEGRAWTPAEAATIAEWLSAELQARGPTTPDTPGVSGTRNPRTAMMMFASCMKVSEAEFTTTQGYRVATMNSQNQGNCASCHGQGAGGFHMSTSNDYKDMLAKWQEEVYFTGVFTPALQPDNTYKIVAAETKICNKGNEKDNSLGTHPEFNCQQQQSTALNALKAFVTQVQAKVDAKDPTCPTPPAFAPPTP